MTEMSAALWMRSDISGGLGVSVMVLGLNVLAMAAGDAFSIPGRPFLISCELMISPEEVRHALRAQGL